MQEDDADQIDAEPTKKFFVDMLTRDIALEQAVLDLVDNSVDGAKALRTDETKLDGLWVKVEFSSETFRITDNCGGFSREAAKKYAFRFGRDDRAARTPHSIGQFGVGMKRALFKFGEYFSVRSATAEDSWAVRVDVETWENEAGWHFPFSDFGDDAEISPANPGTEIEVTNLRPEVATRFALSNFRNLIVDLLKSKHRQFISDGLSVTVNGLHIDATNLQLLVNEGLRPGTDNLTFSEPGKAEVTARIIVAVGPSTPRQAGWYVVCNGRVVLEADRSPVTGWGLLEEAANRTLIPSYHNQFARFRGLVFFDSADSSLVPWNTTKTSVDQDNKYWIATFSRMIEMMRPVIDFLNELDADIEEYSREDSPMSKFVGKSSLSSPEQFRATSSFSAPTRAVFSKGPKTVKIQYSRPVDEVQLLQDALGVTSAKAVGEVTFDSALKRQQR